MHIITVSQAYQVEYYHNTQALTPHMLDPTLLVPDLSLDLEGCGHEPRHVPHLVLDLRLGLDGDTRPLTSL